MEKFVSVTNPKVIENLKLQISNSRIIDWASDFNKDAGITYNRLAYILDYWKNKFSWEKSEKELNSFNQFYFIDEGIKTHFLHIKSPKKNALPLLLIHGWPGSIFEFLDIIPILTNPIKYGIKSEFAFTVIAPSLPGFGLSFNAFQKRFGVEEIGECFKHLMNNVLGYKSFCIQGGDWGAMIGTRMAYKYPDQVIGLHLNMLALVREYEPGKIMSPEEKDYIDQIKKWRPEGMGYQAIQGSRPQTLAYGLSDSPAGLAAWICEKFYEWTDCKGIPENSISFDKMLANISLYWFSGAIGSSFWPYYARNRRSWFVPLGEKVEVPTGYCEFPKEMLRPQRKLAEKTYVDIKRWTKMEQGGHFAALENPEALSKEMFLFFNSLKL